MHIFRKYPHRRIYDPVAKGYATQNEILSMVITEGEDVRIWDVSTDKDVTVEVLLLALAKDEKLLAALPADQLLVDWPMSDFLECVDDSYDQSVTIPMGFIVAFSIEQRHPCGTCRHMSLSSPAKGRAPNEHALWIVAELLGFVGGGTRRLFDLGRTSATRR